MTPALNLAALELTLRRWLNDREVSFEEQDGDVVFEQLELEKGPDLMRPRIRPYRFKRPRTIHEAFDAAVQAGIIEDSPEEREDFLSTYQHFATLPPPMLELERR